GFLTKPNSVDDMVSKIEWLLDNPELRFKMSQSAIIKAKSFDWELILEKLFLKYNEIIQLNKSYKYQKVA
ncbi:MAG: hypothetical protein N3A61_04835, partial [Ignavibacteria bacterium]|nr:hypothetical protein [Ignavibacteria bacterium]